MQRYSYNSSRKCNPKEDLMMGASPNDSKTLIMRDEMILYFMCMSVYHNFLYLTRNHVTMC